MDLFCNNESLLQSPQPTVWDYIMKKPVVIIGIGEIGGVFARGLLRLGHPVYPVTRSMSLAEAGQAINDPQLVLVAVGESDLQPVLQALPGHWRDRVGLLQNELLPGDWQAHVTAPPTVVSVWFEKKPGQDAKVLLPSPIHGPQAGLLSSALAAVGIASVRLEDEQALLYELVRKNLYILTTNIAGLECGGNVEQLWRQHRELAEQVADEVMAIQAHLCGENLDRQKLLHGLAEGIQADPEHKCMGRSAPARLQRALAIAARAQLETPKLQAIHARL